MNKKTLILSTTGAIAAVIFGMLLGAVFFRNNPSSKHNHEIILSDSGNPEATIWTCSMHPQIRQPESGKCPICAMDLIPLVQDSKTEPGPREMTMSESSRALADIQTTEIIRDFPENEVRLVGELAYDETREKSLTARFPARIDELFVNFTGIRTEKGEHLAKVYSPDLLTAQRELITAYQSDPNASISEAAKEKLRLWDLLPEQIDEILASKKAENHFVLKSPISGVVVEKHVNEGDYIRTGDPLFKIVDLSVLWLFMDAYETDLPWIRYGQDVSFTLKSFPGEIFHGRIAFIEPEVNRKTRTTRIRVNVPNPESRLKPGMFVQAVVKSRLAEGGMVYAPEFSGKWISPMHPEIIKDAPGICDVCGMDLVPAKDLGYADQSTLAAPVIIPVSAVLSTGKRAVVYVEKEHTEHPTYEGREVVLGPRAGDFYIVTNGLMPGERVVTNGAFKIDSALQIQAKPSMMNPEVGKDTPQPNIGNATGTPDTHAAHSSDVSLLVPEGEIEKLLKPYLAMQAALADDNMGEAKNQAKEMMLISGHQRKLAMIFHKMMDADSLESLRIPAFETISNALIASIEAHPESVHSRLWVMHCPMANNNTGADWLQASEELRNPYFGSMMLSCGEVKKMIGTTPNLTTEHE